MLLTQAAASSASGWALVRREALDMLPGGFDPRTLHYPLYRLTRDGRSFALPTGVQP